MFRRLIQGLKASPMMFTSKKGKKRDVISQISIILIYEVLGRLSATDTNIVASTLKENSKIKYLLRYAEESHKL